MRQCDKHHKIDLVVKRLSSANQAASPLTLLSDAERERSRRFAFDRDAQRFVMARATLRQLLGGRMNVSPASVKFARGTQGKLALTGQARDSDLRFNLSHSGDLAVYALAVGIDVGVDVEVIRPVPDVDAIVTRWFSPREQSAYRALDQDQKPLGFLTCWTRKEAVLKALGQGLSYGLDHIDVGLTEEPETVVCEAANAGGGAAWFVHTFFPAKGYVGAVAAGVAALPQPMLEPSQTALAYHLCEAA
jgi:4'-phosphopantetheinyl transferase